MPSVIGEANTDELRNDFVCANSDVTSSAKLDPEQGYNEQNYTEQSYTEQEQAEINLIALHEELYWLERVIAQVIGSYLKHEGHENNWFDITPPDVSSCSSIYAQCIRQWSLTIFERLALALTLAPHIRPEILDIFFALNKRHDKPFTEFGGVSDKTFSGFLPSAQTLSFLICANTPHWISYVINILDLKHSLMVEQVLHLQPSEQNLPAWSGILSLSNQWLNYFLTGIKVKPELDPSFPAQPISTPLEWQDLVLEYNVRVQIEEIRNWLLNGDTLMKDWGLAKKIKPGYRALFYGPPGTGKTLTAALLAKVTNREIYRVDLSMIVSKYIGETEKNLSKVFDVASYKDWILFFDEADALFGKRTEAISSNDRHANQQTGYLLQRIEDFPGVVILATNLRANMDDAFTRRFQAMINISMPTSEQRLTLWQNAFADGCPLADDVDLLEIAQKYELAGGSIINVLRYCALQAIARATPKIYQKDIINGLRREFRKDNRTICSGAGK